LAWLCWRNRRWLHLDIRPTLVEQGVVTDIRVELPPLRPGPPPDRLEVEGDGIEVISATLQGTSGSDTVWTVRLRGRRGPRCGADRAQGALRRRQVGGGRPAADGGTPSRTSGFPWVGVVAAVLLAVAFAALSLRLARRKA
jgi:hypothetical protein